MKVKCDIAAGTLYLIEGKYRITSYTHPVAGVSTELTLSKSELAHPEVQRAFQRGWLSEISAPTVDAPTSDPSAVTCPHGFLLDAVCDYCTKDKEASTVEGATVLTETQPPEPVHIERRGRRKRVVDSNM